MENSKMSDPAEVKLQTRAPTLQDQLEAAIVHGEFGPGSRLDESRLAQRFGVSRTPVREALNGLVAAKLVVKRQHASVCVANPPLDEIMEMFELMKVLEAFASSKAARWATNEDLAALKAAHKKCISAAKNGDPDKFFAANQIFHSCIYEAGHNTVLQEQIVALDKRLAPFRRLVTFQPGRVDQSIVEHGAILDAIEKKIEVDASKLMGDHLDLLGEDALTLARAASSWS